MEDKDKELIEYVRKLRETPIDTSDNSLAHVKHEAVEDADLSAAAQTKPSVSNTPPPAEEDEPVADNASLFAATKISKSTPTTPPPRVTASSESVYASAKKAAYTEPRGDSQIQRTKISTKYAFLGTGQSGSRIAECFFGLGYPAIAINTAPQDLQNINIPESNKLLLGRTGGCGKNLAAGFTAADDNREGIYDLMRNCFPDDVDHIIICAGLAGGSGSGSLPILFEVCNYFKKKVGVLLTLPKNSEGTTAKANAYDRIKLIEPLMQSGAISPVILVDNGKLATMHPDASISTFFRKVNSQITGLFHMFNVLSAQNSGYISLDSADYRSVINAKGCLVFGASEIEDHSVRSAIAQALRTNVEKSMLVDGYELTKSRVAGAILTGSKELLDRIPSQNLDYAQECLGRIVGSGTLHAGVYEEPSDTLSVYTLIGGLPLPKARIEELNQ